MLNILESTAPQTLLVVSAGDLQNFAQSVAAGTAAAMKQNENSVQITPVQAARYIGVSVTTLWRWDREDYLVARREGGRKYYTKDQLDAIKGVRK